MELKTICTRLDDILIQYFSELKQFYREQAILEQYMKGGFLNLSRARYNMGVKAVGPSQFNESSMSALFMVHVEEAKLGSEMFQLKSANVSKHVKKSYENSLRKRHPGNEDEVENVGVTQGLEQESNDLPSDPIKWFGVLVPQNLRTCQTDFKQAVELVVTIANLKQSLSSLLNEYRNLLKKKTLML